MLYKELTLGITEVFTAVYLINFWQLLMLTGEKAIFGYYGQLVVELVLRLDFYCKAEESLNFRDLFRVH